MNDWNTVALRDHEDREERRERAEARARELAEREVEEEPELITEELTGEEALDYIKRIMLAEAELTGTDADARADETVKIFTELREGAIERRIAYHSDVGTFERHAA